MGLALLIVVGVLLTSSSTERADESSEQKELAAQPSGFKPVLPPNLPPPAPPAPHPSPLVPTPPPQPPATAPPAATGENAKPPAGGVGKASPPTPPPAEESIEKILAGLTEVGLGSGLQSFNISLVRFYSAVGREAVAAADRLHWRVTDSSRAVLAVDMNVDETASSPSVTLTVELKYTTADGKHITLWKGSKQIVAVDLSAITSANEEHYKETAANNTAVLFEQLVSDVVGARAISGTK